MGGPGSGAVVPGGQLAVMIEHWTIPEAVELLTDAYWVDAGGQGLSPDPVTLEALARALNARPEMLGHVWAAWEDELLLAEWSQERRDTARYWLDAVIIGGIANS